MKLASYIIMLLGMAVPLLTSAQDVYPSEEDMNTTSVRSENIMYKKTVWIRVNLKDKINIPLLSNSHQITKQFIEAVKSGMLKPYQSDKLINRMPKAEFIEKITQPAYIDIELDCFCENPVRFEYEPEDISLLNIKVNMLFDRSKGVWVKDIQAVTMILPAEMDLQTGLEKPLASFSYKELVSNLFSSNPSAIYFNAENQAQHINLKEAFELSLYDGKVIKYTNAKDRGIFEIYNDYRGHQVLIKEMQYRYQLLEYESNLWTN